jgi:hypothetical protein
MIEPFVYASAVAHATRVIGRLASDHKPVRALLGAQEDYAHAVGATKHRYRLLSGMSTTISILVSFCMMFYDLRTSSGCASGAML